MDSRQRERQIEREIDALYYAKPDDMDARIDALEAELARLVKARAAGRIVGSAF